MLALLVLVGSVAFPNAVSACSCAFPGTPQQEFIRADAVFIGKVMGYSGVTILRDFLMHYSPFLDSYLYGERTYIFTVSKSWRGIDQNSIPITSGPTCGYPFLPEKDYVVYASQSGLEYFANICTRTTSLGSASEDLAYLITLPLLPLPAPDRPYLPSILCGGFLPGSIILLFLFFKPHRKKLADSAE
jgi:hypothetical protein